MNRIERLHAITTALQSKRIVKADELAKLFSTSVRTIYRDIRALEHGGVPIGAEAGVGYFITEGYHLPPVMFTKEEARALLMADKVMEKITDPSISRAFGTAVTKVRAVLNAESKDELEGLEDRILVNPFPLNSPEPSSQVLEQLKEAIIHNRVVEVSYISNYKGETTERRVEPIGLVYYSNHWHLIGFCQLRQDYRDFRTDRMARVKLSAECYKPNRHPSLKEYTEKLIQGTELHQVEIKVHSNIIRYIGDSKYAMGLVQERIEGDHHYMLFATISLDYFARWLLMMLEKVEVLQPQQLKDKLKMFAGILINYHHQKEEGEHNGKLLKD
jgi:predicted DNA-binding transcriptional regulator YafY